MIDLDLNGEEPEHVERLDPIIDVDATGKVTWIPGLLDYDASKMYRGKQLTSEELNKLLLKQIYQGNYTADSLKEFFDNHLGEAILNHFRSDYDLTSNYIKIFLSTDWGELGEDGYYTIDIPASEHGFIVDESEDVLERMNIQVSMYLYKDGKFHEAQQYSIDDENKVTLYTDDTTVIGFVVIQDNNKAFSITEGNITIGQVTGLSSRLDGYGARITANENNIGGIRSGSLAVGHATLADEATHATDADNAENLTTKIRNISLDKIFETGSRNVKQATRALRLSELNANDSSETYVEVGSPTQPVYFNAGRPVAITGALANNITGNANTATEATHAASADTATRASKANSLDLTIQNDPESIVNLQTLLNIFKPDNATNVKHYLSGSSTTADVRTITNWTDFESNVTFKRHISLGGYCDIYCGLLYNPSGKGDDWWYRIDLPDSAAYTHKVVIANPVHYTADRSGNIVGTYFTSSSKSVYISRDRFDQGDRANVSYMIITFPTTIASGS